MPEAYCRCCRKMTPHKRVMQRSRDQGLSLFTWFVMLFNGEHYMKMEQQTFCRVCNTRTERVKTASISRAHTV